MIKVLLADDHTIVLDGLAALLEKEKGIHIVDSVPDGNLALKALELHEIDIAILDIEMPIMDGIETTKIINERFPEVRVLILTMHKGSEFILQLVDAGASGFVLKNRGKEELVDAIETIANGDRYFGDIVTEALIQSRENEKRKKKVQEIILTKREKEVLKLIANGLTTPQIAKQLFIAHSTVETHRRHLIDKTGVSNSKALIAYAINNHLLKKS